MFYIIRDDLTKSCRDKFIIIIIILYTTVRISKRVVSDVIIFGGSDLY
jgi:hypothetical protein